MSLERSEIILTIPCLPDLDLSANRRRSRHFMRQARDTANERTQAGLILITAAREARVDALPRFNELGMRIDGWPPTTPIVLHWTLYWPRGIRSRDADGCADLLKPWQDAMVDLRWIKNDSPRYVGRVSYESVPSSLKGPSMTLRIESG